MTTNYYFPVEVKNPWNERTETGKLEFRILRVRESSVLAKITNMGTTPIVAAALHNLLVIQQGTRSFVPIAADMTGGYIARFDVDGHGGLDRRGADRKVRRLWGESCRRCHRRDGAKPSRFPGIGGHPGRRR